MTDPQLTDIDGARQRLGLHGGNQPVLTTLVPVAAVLDAIFLSGALMAKEATHERHVLRYAFMAFDRIRTGEVAAWHCTLCERRKNRGLRKLAKLGVIQHAIGDPVPSKPAVVALICKACDSDDDELERRICKAFGFVPVQHGHA